MLREYELTVISRSDLAEADTVKALSKYEALMTKDGGQILKKEVWGSKRLAFPINKQFKGIYTFYDFFAVPDNVKEAERLMKIDENLLRHLTIRGMDARNEADIEARKVEINRPKPQPTQDD